MPVGRPVLSGKAQIAAGQRWRRATLEQLTSGNTDSGFPGETWAALATVWVSKLDVRADERLAAGQESAYFESQWHLEFRSDMDPEVVDVAKTRRINYRDRIYNIRSAALVDREKGIELITLAQPDEDA